MKVVKMRFAPVVGLATVGLLLIIATSCSFEKKVEGQAKEELFTANSFCIACHYGFEEEQLALDHELAGIGCERCHGESERHRSDEDNITPPELMYPKSRINPTCMMCHPRGEIKGVHAHETILAGAETIFDSEAESEKAYCTDCHGKGHRVGVPRVRWNKATGELIESK